MSNFNFTYTCIGPIEHMRHPSGFDMPVRLVTVGRKVILRAKLPIPVTSGDKFVYALPGGGEYVV